MVSSIKIMAATYGPANGLKTGTRDVAPFLKTLLLARKQQEEDEIGSATPLRGDSDEDIEQTGLYIPLMNGKSTNEIFGDPCPGTSKCLIVHYVVYEENAAASKAATAATSEVHRATFAEHERVILRRRVTFYQDECKLKEAVVAVATNTTTTTSNNEKEKESTLRTAVRMGRAQSIAEFAEVTQTKMAASGSLPSSLPSRTRLRSATSEIVLPIVLPYLSLKERVNCQLVCKVWRIIVRQWGVAQTVDANDPSFRSVFSRAFLRGILSHSYTSLQNLYLSDFKELTRDDLHPAIPHLRKLRALDISRCNELDNSTLQLIAEHLSHSLEVLYMKGLSKVTDEGFMSICRSCLLLQVLEISNVKITDESGIAIGENLTQLRALYMRDNFLLTNKSIDVITEKCTRLAQLTLWGCIRVKSLSFEHFNQVAGNLVLLNLWGCHNLLDEAADALASMNNLRTLIVSECHRLTDAFLVTLAQNVPKLAHLHLRYCKRVTDAGINAVTNAMQDLYSLDLSFCTHITSASILNLLEIRSNTLSELRMRNCSQLHIPMNGQSNDNRDGNANAGSVILNVLQSSADGNCLCILDVNGCGGHQNTDEKYSDGDPFVKGMKSLQFQQVVPGFFSRPARWNDNVRLRLANSLPQFA